MTNWRLHSSRWKSRVPGCVVAILLIVTCIGVFWPKGPKLEPYLSEPITYQREALRVQMLIPQGWKPDPDAKTIWINSERYPAIWLYPPPGPTWLPQLLQQLFRGSPHGSDHLTVIVGI